MWWVRPVQADFTQPLSIRSMPFPFFYQPSAIASYQANGNTQLYIVDSNGEILTSYDQGEWRVLAVDEDYAGITIQDLATDSVGNLYVAFADRILQYDGMNWSFFANSENEGFSRIKNIGLDGNNRFYCFDADSNSLKTYDGSSWQNYSSFFPTNVEAMTVLPNGKVFLVINSSAIYAFNGTFWLPFASNLGQISNLAATQDNRLFAMNVTSNQVLEIDANSGSILQTLTHDFNGPQDLAMEVDGALWIVDQNNNALQIFNGSTWEKIGGKTGLGHFNNPGRMVMDHAQNLYVVDSGNAEIQKYDGSKWSAFPLEYQNQNFSVTALAVDEQNQLYASDPANGRILQYDGTQWQLFATFSQPLALAFAKDNTLYVTSGADNEIHVFSQQDWSTLAGPADGFDGPASMAVDQHNNIYVADVQNNRILLRHADSQQWSTLIESGSSSILFSQPNSVAVDEGGNLYVTNSVMGNLLKYDGQQWFTYGQNGFVIGHFITPYGIAVSADATTLYVSDSYLGRLTELTYEALNPVSPTPGKPEVTHETRSAGFSAAMSPQCMTDRPEGTPELFQIDVNDTQAILYFVPVAKTTDYYLAYSEDAHLFRYGTFVGQGFASGVLSYRVSALQPNTTYYFQVRGQNGCMPGYFGNQMKVRTKKAGLKNFSATYKNILSNLPHQLWQ